MMLIDSGLIRRNLTNINYTTLDSTYVGQVLLTSRRRRRKSLPVPVKDGESGSKRLFRRRPTYDDSAWSCVLDTIPIWRLPVNCQLLKGRMHRAYRVIIPLKLTRRNCIIKTYTDDKDMQIK
jgi:hypothetical protein